MSEEIECDGDYSLQAEEPLHLLSSYVFHGVHFPHPGLLNAGGFATIGKPDTIYDLECRADDIFVSSYPKSGNTWMREIAYRIVKDPDVKKLDTRIQDIRCPDLELYDMEGGGWKGHEAPPLKDFDSPRVMKCHSPWNCMPKASTMENSKSKIIYVSRNFKDVAVSFYFFGRGIKLPGGDGYIFTDDMNTMTQRWMNPKSVYGGYAFHNLGFWEQRHRDNVLFMFYEDMVKDPVAAVKKVATFLGQKLTDEQVMKIVVETSFDKMKNDPSCNWEFLADTGFRAKDSTPFMRKGKVGNWKEHFDDELNKMADDFIEKSFKGTGLTFTYEF